MTGAPPSAKRSRSSLPTSVPTASRSNPARRSPTSPIDTLTTTTRPTSTSWRIARSSTTGLQSYEISNWSRPGHECKHNLLYWSQGDYLGIGCAAHSHRDGRRWWNVRTPDRYIDAISAGGPPIAASEHLDDDERRIEGLQLLLRTRAGVPRSALPEGLDDLVEPQGDRLVLTVRGRLLANEVALRLS